MTMFIDSHAHLTSPEMLADLNLILERAKLSKVSKIVNICTDKESLEQGLNLAKREPWIFNTAATTPHDVQREGEEFFPFVEKCAREKQLVAIGETGLDYHYEHSPKEIQKNFLMRYFALAISVSLPIVIHCRDAFSDLFELADASYKTGRLLLHCYTGTIEEAKEALDRGWSISLSGIVTFKKSHLLREVARYIPEDRLLVETDAPYLAPEGRRGQRNEPAFIHKTVQCIAKIRQVMPEELARVTAKNAERFFSF